MKLLPCTQESMKRARGQQKDREPEVRGQRVARAEREHESTELG